MKSLILILVLFAHSAFSDVCVEGWEQIEDANHFSAVMDEFSRENPYLIYADTGVRCEDVRELSDDLETYSIVLGMGAAVLCSTPITAKVGVLVGLTSGGLALLKVQLNKIDCTEGASIEVDHSFRHHVCLDLEEQGVRCNPSRISVEQVLGIPGLEI